MGKAVEATQRLITVVGREQFELRLRLGHQATLTRDTELFLERGMDDADDIEGVA